ncbi:hypothetical protein CHS0354_030773 [Potamilus streckersoni]|uniref:BTB domain-containing protein n=1 Tax=Potamilus streckersoni TaxID=2493646 RepID=A0AAE0WAP6_9BIVA|nr:hypothetical protein CHS0354_030773 [Potamilus streckersoni]
MNFIISNPMDAGQHHSYFHLSPNVGGFQDVRDHKRSHSGSSFQPSIHASEAPPQEEEIRLLEQEPDGSVCKLDGISEGNHKYNSVLAECTRTVINISGLRFETQLKTLNRLPSTLLGNEEKRKKYWDPVRKEYFFDRHRPSFPAILYYYQSGGRLKRPLEVPLDIFLEELEFYELGRVTIDMYKESEGMIFEEQPWDMPDNSLNKLWILFEHPNSSIPARIIGIVSVVLIMLSVVVFCLETLPVFKPSCFFTVKHNDSGETESFSYTDYTNWMFICESVCIAWFVLEFVVRMISCPSKIMFWKSIVNWIDLAAIVPYFVIFGMSLTNQTCLASNKSGLLQVVRVLRVVRIFKLAKHSQGLKILGKTLQLSISELNTFLIFFAIGVVVFSTMVYFADKGESESYFTSIPDAFWWAVITMTTVGYGDEYPVGIAGKLVGGLCALSGLLAISLPVPVIVTNFNNIYKNTTGRGRET